MIVNGSNIVRKSYGGHMGSYEANIFFLAIFGDFSIFGGVFPETMFFGSNIAICGVKS